MSNYKDKKNVEIRQKANEIIDELPDYVNEYFMAREISLSAMSIYSYAGQLRTFFEFLSSSNSYFKAKSIKEISFEDLDNLNDADVTEFLHHLRNYPEKDANGNVTYITCSDRTISHYMVALNTFWKYLVAHGMVKTNPIAMLSRKRLNKKEVIYLNKEEKEEFLEAVEEGTGLTKRQAKYHEKNSIRDKAIMLTFLSTGIRVSELVGMDLKDISFKKHSINVFRKGGNFDRVYFSDTAEAALQEYLEIREKRYSPAKDETAVFLNRDGKRISVRSVEILVKKYINASLPHEADRITPHKLRSTFAETMLKATGGDLERVQKLLGHSSITSTMHYVDSTEAEKEEVRNLSI